MYQPGCAVASSDVDVRLAAGGAGPVSAPSNTFRLYLSCMVSPGRLRVQNLVVWSFDPEAST